VPRAHGLTAAHVEAEPSHRRDSRLEPLRIDRPGGSHDADEIPGHETSGPDRRRPHRSGCKLTSGEVNDPLQWVGAGF
jgi:hypothetical protein